MPMDEAKSIMRMTPVEGAELALKAASSPTAARTLLFYSAWRTIRADKRIPSKARLPLMRAIINTVEVLVEA